MLVRRSAASSPPKFVYLDMEEYRDLELTIAAFTTVLVEPEFDRLDAGVVLQAYLPVVILTNYDRYGVLPGNNINSGPGFVTKDGLTLVEKWAGEYR